MLNEDAWVSKKSNEGESRDLLQLPRGVSQVASKNRKKAERDTREKTTT